MDRLSVFFIALTFISCATSQSVVSPPYSTSEMNMDDAPKPDLLNVDQYIQEHVNSGKIPGGTFYITHRGNVIYHKSFGEKYPGVNYDNNDIYRIASMTKALTTVAILQLYERGKLKLDDPIEKYIPAFAETAVLDKVNPVDSSYTTIPKSTSITVRHLLTHTSGIYYGQFEGGDRQIAHIKSGIDGFGIAIPKITTMEIANMIARAPLAHQPGTQWTYGLNMDVLGAIVEVISGESLDDYFQTNIIQKVGMTNTGFNLPESKHKEIVPLYTYEENGQLKIDKTDIWMFPAGPDEDGHFGGGGMASTAEDYGKFIQALMNKGVGENGRILSRHTIELMTTDQIGHLTMQGKGMSSVPGLSFCLGHALVTPLGAGYGPHKPGTYSWGGYFNSKWWVDEEEELTFVGMTNVLPFPYPEFWDKLYPIIYATLD